MIKKVYGFSEDDGETYVGEPRWFFDSKEEAQKHAKKLGWWGGPAHVREYNCICIDDYCYIVSVSFPASRLNETPNDVTRKKQQALSKLTVEERKLLGLE